MRLFVDVVVALDVGGAAADEDYDVAEVDMGASSRRRGRIKLTSSGRTSSRSRMNTGAVERGQARIEREGRRERMRLVSVAANVEAALHLALVKFPRIRFRARTQVGLALSSGTCTGRLM